MSNTRKVRTGLLSIAWMLLFVGLGLLLEGLYRWAFYVVIVSMMIGFAIGFMIEEAKDADSK